MAKPAVFELSPRMGAVFGDVVDIIVNVLCMFRLYAELTQVRGIRQLRQSLK
jgi:hypothetical protein